MKRAIALSLLCLFSYSFTMGQMEKDISKPVSRLNFIIPSLPDSFSFAGETVPLHNQLIREQWERELLYNADFLTNIVYIIKLSGRHFPALEAMLREQGIPEDMKYLCVAESNLQQLVSKAGAAGFWQFMPQTATQYGLEVSKYVDERFHIEKSTKAACTYLKSAYKLLGSWTAAAASYNCGKGGYNAATTFQKTKNYYDLMLPEETNRYVFRILTFKYLMENAEAFGLNKETDLYQPVLYKKVQVASGVNDLTAFAIKNNTTYKELRMHNPWIKSTMLSAGKKYTLLIPENNYASQ